MPPKPVHRPYPLPPNEQERLAALHAYDILDTPPETSFDRITAMAARLFHAPISLVSLLDDQRQWFKAKCGLATPETPRSLSFCAYAILQDLPLVVCDATQDVRFQNNALVTGDPFIRFYVAAPLKTPAGLSLGTLCVIDTVPREYPDPNLLSGLTDLAYLVVEQLQSRLVLAAQMRAEEQYRVLAETARDLVLIVDDAGQVVSVNPACRPLLGYEPADLIGQPLTLAIPGCLPLQDGVLECSAHHKSGRVVPFEVSFSHFALCPGFFSAIARDLSERQEHVRALKAAADALRSKEAKLKEAQELANLGHWERDLRTGAVSWSDEAYRLLAWPPDTSLSFEQFQQMLPMEDRPALYAGMVQSTESGEPFKITHRIIRCDGAIRYWESRGRVECDSDGPTKLLGTMIDVTARVEALQNSKEELERRVEQRTELLDRSRTALLAEIEQHKLTQTLVAAHNRILRRIAAGSPISQIFDDLLRFGETESQGGFVASVFLKSEDGQSLRRVAAPRLPAEIRSALPIIGMAQANPAAAAVSTGQLVVTAIHTGDEFPGADLLQRHLGTRYLAATPILGNDNEVLGAVSLAMRAEPTEHQLRVLYACASLAAVALLRDTEQANLRLSEQAIRAAEHRLQVGLGFARVVVWTWFVKEDRIDWSGPVKQVFGRERDALSSYAALRELILPADREIVHGKISDSVSDGRDYLAEFRVVHPRGDVRWVAGMGGAKMNDLGAVVQMSGVNFDITERKRAEQKLAVSELHFRELAESMPQIVWTADAAGEFEYCNRRWYDLTGLPLGATSQQAWKQVLHPDDVAPWLAAQVAVHRDGQPCEMEFRIWDAARQSYRWHLGRKEPIIDGNGAVTRCYGTCTDIHHRKMEEIKLAQSERALRQREQQLALLFDTGSIGDFVWDLQTGLVTAHPTVWKLFGEADGHGSAESSWFTSRYHPLDAAKTMSALREAREGKQPLNIEYRVLWPDGTVRWLANIGVFTRDRTGQPVQLHGLGMDITERKTAELRILESERQLREQADAMPLIVWRSSPNGQIDYCNTRWQEFTGYSLEETNNLGWESIIHPDDWGRCSEHMSRALADEIAFALEFRAKRAADGQYRWLLAQCFPFHDRDGKLLRWFGASIDIDDQKTLNERLEAQVLSRTAELQRSVMEKETLLKEVHHRVKNNLQIISSLLRIQENSLQDKRASAALKDSQQRVLAMALIHERLYGGKQLDEIDFGEYARALVQEIFSSLSPHAAHIRTRFEGPSVLLNIDQAIPCGLILNELVTNALKYAYPQGKSGEILVALSETSGRVSLTVSDHGIGLPASYDWSRSKSMGLPIADLLAKQIGGTLTARSQPGATFTVEFPRLAKDAKAMSA